MDPSLTFDCLVAVTEACTNALTHGHSGFQEEPWPLVHWEVGGSEARFFVKDYSTRQWSRTSHPSRDIDYLESGEDRVGGFGLELMRQLMDEVDISMGPEGTTVCLVKRFRDV